MVPPAVAANVRSGLRAAAAEDAPADVAADAAAAHCLTARRIRGTDGRQLSRPRGVDTEDAADDTAASAAPRVASTSGVLLGVRACPG